MYKRIITCTDCHWVCLQKDSKEHKCTCMSSQVFRYIGLVGLLRVSAILIQIFVHQVPLLCGVSLLHITHIHCHQTDWHYKDHKQDKHRSWNTDSSPNVRGDGHAWGVCSCKGKLIRKSLYIMLYNTTQYLLQLWLATHTYTDAPQFLSWVHMHCMLVQHMHVL